MVFVRRIYYRKWYNEAMTTQPWYLAGDFVPTHVVDGVVRVNSGVPHGKVTFGYGRGEPGFEFILYIQDALTAEQVRIACDLQWRGLIRPGRYVDWKQFAMIHGLE